ncbi:MAG: zinc ribbon domain-containing protein [Firmicutes bacterium]|nr:zinc ribbon domain-containing protein [Bacillota bacterium]
MFCSHCGTQNETSALFCTKCGAQIAGEVPAPTQPPQPQGWPLTITRESQFTGALVGATVTLDGHDCGSLTPGQSLTFTVPGQIVHVSLKIWSMAPLQMRLRLWQGAHVTCGIKLGAFVNKLVIKNVAGAEVLEMP